MVGDTGMKQTFKVKLVTGLFGTSLALGAAAILGYQPQNAYAAAANGFQMVEGASVRLTDENRGIRFAAQFGEDFYNEEAEYHMMIIPAPLVDKYSLTQDSDFYKVLVEQNKLNVAVTDCLPEEKDGAYRIYGSLTDILYQNSNRTFFGVAYRELAGERVYASYIDGQNERTICEVAGHALNDLSKTYTEDDKNYLLGMINDAYKNELGLGKDDTPETALKDALSVKASADNFIATKGDKISLGDTIVSVNSEVTDKLNLSLGVYSADETIVNAGKGLALTAAADKSGMTSVGSVLLGEKVAASERKVMVRSEMAGNMLEDYADECSKSQFARDMQTDTNGNVATEYYEEFAGRNGVIKMKSGIGGNSGVVRYFYNRSYEEMINLDFDYISIWAYFDNLGDGNETVKITNGSIVLGNAVEPGKWAELKISKADIDSDKSFYKSYETYCARHDQAKQHGTPANNGTALFFTSIVGIDVYLDSVSFVKVSVDGDTPVAGAKYSVPQVTLLGIDKQPLETTSTVTATRNGEAVTIKNGEISNIYRGAYELNYVISVDGQYVNYTLSYNVTDMAANMLEDFDIETSKNNVKTAAGGTYPTTSFYTTYHDTFEGRTGVVETITSQMGGYGQARINARFNKTYDELLAMWDEYDYISIWIYIDADNSFSVASHNNRFIAESDNTVQGRQWSEIRMSKEVVLASNSYYGSQFSGLTNLQAFAEVHASDRSYYAGYLFVIASGGTKAPYDYDYTNETQFKVYIDSISFGKNA